MTTRCRMELCTHWSGDGDVCPCVVFGMQPNTPDWVEDESPEGIEWQDAVGGGWPVTTNETREAIAHELYAAGEPIPGPLDEVHVRVSDAVDAVMAVVSPLPAERDRALALLAEIGYGEDGHHSWRCDEATVEHMAELVEARDEARKSYEAEVKRNLDVMADTQLALWLRAEAVWRATQAEAILSLYAGQENYAGTPAFKVMNDLAAARARVDALSGMLRGMARRAGALRSERDEAREWADCETESVHDVQRKVLALEAELARAVLLPEDWQGRVRDWVSPAVARRMVAMIESWRVATQPAGPREGTFEAADSPSPAPNGLQTATVPSEREAAQPEPQDEARDCGRCYRCLKPTFPAWGPDRMILCPDCGNKRCPRATDHRHACTRSNEPGQPGSRYGALPGPQPKPSALPAPSSGTGTEAHDKEGGDG